MVAVYVAVFIFSLLIGSFLNVCICRIPSGKSIVAPPSSCMKCGKRLGPAKLIPVFSYIFLGGRCKCCKEPISPQYPLVELLTAAVFTTLLMRYGLSVPSLAFIFLMSVLIAVFFID